MGACFVTAARSDGLTEDGKMATAGRGQHVKVTAVQVKGLALLLFGLLLVFSLYAGQANDQVSRDQLPDVLSSIYMLHSARNQRHVMY
jgi:hypothetical protein